MRLKVTDLGKTVTFGLLAWRETRTFAACTPCLSAIFWTTSFLSNGEPSDPRGEYAVNTIPFAIQ